MTLLPGLITVLLLGVGPTGTWRVGLDPLPHAFAKMETTRIPRKSVCRDVVIDRPRYSSNNELTVNLFIKIRG